MPIVLPTGPNVPKTDFRQQCVWLHGEPKAGKSTLLDQSDVLIFSTENRHKHMKNAAVLNLVDWPMFVEACREFVKQKKFMTLVIDSVTNLWKFAGDDYCRRKGIKYLMDEKYKEGYGMCQADIHRELLGLTNRGYGLWLVAHSVSKIVPEAIGDGKFIEREKMVPDGHDRLKEIIEKINDCEMYMEHAGGKRLIHPNPSDRWEAGTNLPYGCGKLPDAIHIPDGGNGYEILLSEWEKAVAPAQKA